MVVYALLTCSDEECTEVYEVYGRLAEFDALACECGYGLAIVGWPDEVESDAAPSVVPAAVEVVSRPDFRPKASAAGDRGIEPRAAVLETAMFPLHQSP